MMKSRNFKAILAIAIVISLIILLIVAMYPFIQGFFAALILFVLFNPLYNYFVKKGVNKKLSAVLIILISTLLVLIPFAILLSIIIREVISTAQDPVVLQGVFNWVNSVIERFFPGTLLSEIINSNLTVIVKAVNNFVIQAISQAGVLFINIIIMYFTFYYLLTQKEKAKKAKEIIPFNKKNSELLISKFKDITYSTVIVTGIIAIVQSSLIAASFLIFGIQSWLLWGFIAAILSFIPVLGPPIIWVPAVIYMFVQGNYTSAIGILIFGIVLSNIDNLIRPYLQQKVGKIHPLTTLIGIFIGIPLFGILGIIIGPLTISYVLLTLRMFKEEYLK